jgi:hypothetical protein
MERMSRLLDAERRLTPPAAGAGAPSPILAGVLAAAQAAGASLTVVMVPVVLTWATAAYSRAPWSQAMQFGIDTWLLGHHAGLVLPGGHLGLTPIGLILVPLLSCWLAGVRLARTLDPAGEAIRSRVGQAKPSLPPARALVAMVGAYTGGTAVACGLGSGNAVRPVAAQALVGAVVIGSLGGLAGAAAWAERGRIAGLRLILDWLRLPRLVRDSLPAAGLAIGLQLAAGLVLLVLALVLGHGQVMLLHRSLAPGLIGGSVLVLAQAVALPNLVIWAVSYAAGPGFAVGSGSHVRPGGVHLGALPAVPVLGGLPDSPMPTLVAWLLPGGCAAFGVVAGWYLMRRTAATSWPAVLAEAFTTVALIGVGWLALGWLSGGAAGPGRLASTGPTPWLLALAVVAEVGTGLLLTACGMQLVRQLSRPVEEPRLEL